jgi:rod shape-determining protein MreC
MVPRIFQPIVIVLIIGVLLGLRTLAELSPLQRWLAGEPQVVDTAFEPQQSQAVRLEAEVERLRRELGFTQNDSRYVRADVLSKTVASFREALRIAAGRRHGLKPDQPVLSEGHLIGRVSQVEDSLATVLLLGDPDVRIPVVIGQAQGIVVPQTGGLVIDQVVGEVERGQSVISSGVDGIYPPGLLVGVVGEELERDIFGRYVLLTPLNITQLTFVSVAVAQR